MGLAAAAANLILHRSCSGNSSLGLDHDVVTLWEERINDILQRAPVCLPAARGARMERFTKIIIREAGSIADFLHGYIELQSAALNLKHYSHVKRSDVAVDIFAIHF